MRKLTLFLALVALFAGMVSFESSAYPAIDACTAALIGHSVTAFNLNQCLAADPPQPCTYEQLAHHYAVSQVLY